MIRESDACTYMPRPKKPGASTVGFRDAIFVVELLTPEQVLKEEPLRQDAAFYKQRTAELQKVLLTTHRATLLANDHSLAHGAEVLRDPTLRDEVRKRLNAWIDLTPAEVRGAEFPGTLLDALRHCGDDSDLALLNRLTQRHPSYARHLLWNTLYLAKRTGGAKAMPLWTVLVQDSEAESTGEGVSRLRALDSTIPASTRGDLAIDQMVRVFKLDPAKFHLRLAQAILLKRADQAKLTPAEKDQFQTVLEYPRNGHWLYLTEADRQRGQKAALEWLAAYRPK